VGRFLYLYVYAWLLCRVFIPSLSFPLFKIRIFGFSVIPSNYFVFYAFFLVKLLPKKSMWDVYTCVAIRYQASILSGSPSVMAWKSTWKSLIFPRPFRYSNARYQIRRQIPIWTATLLLHENYSPCCCLLSNAFIQTFFRFSWITWFRRQLDSHNLDAQKPFLWILDIKFFSNFHILRMRPFLALIYLWISYIFWRYPSLLAFSSV